MPAEGQAIVAGARKVHAQLSGRSAAPGAVLVSADCYRGRRSLVQALASLEAGGTKRSGGLNGGHCKGEIITAARKPRELAGASGNQQHESSECCARSPSKHASGERGAAQRGCGRTEGRS